MIRTAIFAVLFSLLFSTSSLSAQSSTATSPTADTSEVLVGCYSEKTPAPALTLDKMAAKGTELKRLTALPAETAFDYVVVFDISTSAKQVLSVQDAIAATLLHSLVRAGRDRGTIIFVRNTPLAANGFTTDPELILKAVRSAGEGGGTAFYDALSLAADKLLELSQPGPRFVFAITDGEDTWSKLQREEAIQKLLAAGVHVIAISPVDASDDSLGGRVLREITAKTGGFYFSSGETSEEKLKKANHKEYVQLTSLFQHWYRLEVEHPASVGNAQKFGLKAKAGCRLAAPTVLPAR